MKNVFSISPAGKDFTCKSVVLFDDVFTTGATACSAAGVLKRHAVQSVWVVTMAR